MPYPLDFLSIPTESGGDDARHYSADEVVDHNRKRVVREIGYKGKYSSKSTSYRRA